MKIKLTLTVMAVTLASMLGVNALANAGDYDFTSVWQVIQDIQSGANNGNRIEHLRVGTDAAIAQLTISGATTVAAFRATGKAELRGNVVIGNDGNANITSNSNPVVNVPASVTATNTYTIGAVWPTYYLLNSTATVSNNVNIANAPGGKGQDLKIVAMSSNSFWLGDASNIDLTAAFLMGTNDTLTLTYNGEKWVETGRANN